MPPSQPPPPPRPSLHTNASCAAPATRAVDPFLDDDQQFCEQYTCFWTAARRQRFLVRERRCPTRWVGWQAARLIPRVFRSRYPSAG